MTIWFCHLSPRPASQWSSGQWISSSRPECQAEQQGRWISLQRYLPGLTEHDPWLLSDESTQSYLPLLHHRASCSSCLLAPDSSPGKVRLLWTCGWSEVSRSPTPQFQGSWGNPLFSVGMRDSFSHKKDYISSNAGKFLCVGADCRRLLFQRPLLEDAWC